MKKRILSVLLVVTMLLASSFSAFALNEYDVLDKAGTVLDEVTTHSETGWQKDASYHAEQLAAIEAAAAAIDSADISEYVDAIIVYDKLTTNQKLYLCALAKAGDDTDIAGILNSYNTSGETWKNSFDLLKNFSNHLGSSESVSKIAPYGDVGDEYERVLGDADDRARLEACIEHAIKNLLKVAFSSTGAPPETNYDTGIECDDITKKTLMVFASEVIEKEGIPFRTAASVGALATAAKDYALDFKNDANINLAKAAADRVASAPYTETIAKAFDEAAANVEELKKGTEEHYFSGKDVLDDIRLLAGDGTNKGLVEEILEEVDTDFEATNMLLNIALSKGIQLYRPAGRIADLRENATPAETLAHTNSINIKTERVDFRGRVVEPIALNTGWFDIEFYEEDGSKLGGVSYNDGTVSIVKDISKGGEYGAYMVLYRKDASGGAKTFIETYPVKIDFTEGTTTRPTGTSTTKYTVTFETNGGSEISPVRYSRGVTVQLTMVPTREGYIFDGWYSDAELTNKIEAITVNAAVTVYAGWKKDGSTVVSKVEIPELLEDKDHYAYVMGYPEGGIRPNGSITRAEAVTMIFRLLKEDVRKANLTEVSAFEDVTADDWFNAAVSTLAKLGVVEGRSETTFDPNANITRAEFATMFARLAEYDFVAENKYGDVDGHWAKAFVEEVDAYGWIAGYEDDTFRPDNKISRAEAMTLINRVLKRNPETKADLLDGMTIWTDNADETAWYYLAVQEATNSHEYTRRESGFEAWTKLVENKDWTAFEK